MQITYVSRIEKIIRKAGSVAVILLFALNEGLHFGLHWGFLTFALALTIALVCFLRTRTFSRAENLFMLLFMAAAGISHLVFHRGESAIELAIPWFILMFLWYGVRECRSDSLSQSFKADPYDSDGRQWVNTEYRPGPDGIGGYYQNGILIVPDSSSDYRN